MGMPEDHGHIILGNVFSYLCNNVRMCHFALYETSIYHQLTLKFLITLSHMVSRYPGGKSDRITFWFMNINFDLLLYEWYNLFGFTNNDGHFQFFVDHITPPPMQIFWQMSVCHPIPKASVIECPSCFITNTFQARGEFTKVDEEEMMT